MTAIFSDELAMLAIQALERTAFVLVDAVENEEEHHWTEEEATGCLFSRIQYTGPASGQIILAGSHGFVIELASSLLGVEPEEVDIETEGKDALKELANILGGSVLVELDGQHIDYRLQVPEECKIADWPTELEVWAHCRLASEEEWLEIVWSSDRVGSEGKPIGRPPCPQ